MFCILFRDIPLPTVFFPTFQDLSPTPSGIRHPAGEFRAPFDGGEPALGSVEFLTVKSLKAREAPELSNSQADLPAPPWDLPNTHP
jgi:hypothetical protein